MRIDHQDQKRAANRFLILKEILQAGPISRVEIAERTDRSRALVTNITAELIEQNIVRETKSVPSGRKGRRRVHLALNPEAAFVVGVKIMTTSVSLVVTDFQAGVLSSVYIPVQAGVRRLVFLSSLKVLGEASPPGHPLQARSTPQPTDPYGLTKWEAENALRAIGNASGLEVVVIRPPLVYGPGVKANFARLVQAVARGIPLPLGSVHNKRSLVGMDNLTDLIQCCVQLPSAAHQTFLVSDGVDTSTPELIQAIAHAMGRPARLWRVPVGLLRLAGRLSGQGAQVERLTGSLQVDIRHTREVLGWTPQVTLQQGLQSVVQDYLK